MMSMSKPAKKNYYLTFKATSERGMEYETTPRYRATSREDAIRQAITRHGFQRENLIRASTNDPNA